MMDGGSNNAHISVALVDDEEIWGAGVRTVLGGTEFAVVGEARTISEAAHLLRESRPRLVLLSIYAPGASLAKAFRVIRHGAPDTYVIVVAASEAVTVKAEALAGGAAAFVSRTISCAGLIGVLRRVIRGERLLTTRDLARTPRLTERQILAGTNLRKPLTKRELEVLSLLAVGLSNVQIAEVLFVARSTIKTHVENIIAKLGVSNRVEAVSWAMQQGVVAPVDRRATRARH